MIIAATKAITARGTEVAQDARHEVAVRIRAVVRLGIETVHEEAHMLS